MWFALKLQEKLLFSARQIPLGSWLSFSLLQGEKLLVSSPQRLGFGAEPPASPSPSAALGPEADRSALGAHGVMSMG